MIAGLFDDADDEQAVTKVLQVLTEDSIRSLSKGEKQLISLYNKPPNELEEMLYIGCSNIVVEAKSDITSTGTPHDLPCREFCCLVYRIVWHLFYTYKTYHFLLPVKNSESWFWENLWIIINWIFNVNGPLTYEPGEINSQASARQKNRERESVQWKQQVGRKVDGLVSCISPPFEMLVVEAANVDNGPQGTKAMTDTLKLSKTMKDMFDSILE